MSLSNLVVVGLIVAVMIMVRGPLLGTILPFGVAWLLTITLLVLNILYGLPSLFEAAESTQGDQKS